MTLKRALVVDDSKAARFALKKLLEAHQLDVALASSGEAALEYLQRHSVDVVFMDHTMPGMDGLEAVSAIKANPATATIPVMMYTTKEGEVYVGQARALGAVGVLPKNVQPHQLFEMLRKLGLVTERRAEPRAPVTEPIEATQVVSGLAHPSQDADADPAPAQSDADRLLEHQALGMSLQALVTRILEDQHVKLRSDVLRTHKRFAKEVAHEVVKEQAFYAAEEEELRAEMADAFVGAEQDNGSRRHWLGNAFIGVTLAVSLFLLWQFKTQRDDALLELANTEQRLDTLQTDSVSQLSQLQRSQRSQQTGFQERAIEALKWSLNEHRGVSFDAPHYDADLADKMAQLLAHLDRIDFAGEVRLISHLGEFCLIADESGRERPAQGTTARDCTRVGHPQGDSSYVSDRLSVEFSRLMQGPLNPDIELQLVALDANNSQPRQGYPDLGASAEEWNSVARWNNRVQIDILPRR
ncbi:MAG: response regulator [Pseudomonadota bacterium]